MPHRRARDRVSVTVPVEGLPPTTLDGFTVRELNPAATGVTVRGAVRVTPPYTAEIVTAVEPDTDNVVTANVALVAPAATVTLDGTVAADVLLLDSDTSAPPAGAGPRQRHRPRGTVPSHHAGRSTGKGTTAMAG